MDAIALLKEAGFAQVIALDAAECGAELEGGTLLLAVWTYVPEQPPEHRDVWVHPYYPASQKAHTAARSVVEKLGEGAALRPDIRLKPLFARLPMFSQGRNTISYLEGMGSNFHVQTIHLKERLEQLTPLEAEKHPLHCGSCCACMEACPAGAIDEEGFHREKCINNWMLMGKAVPEELRPLMGNRLRGCNECQRVCPHNHAAVAPAAEPYELEKLLRDAKGCCEELKNLIGVNLAVPNRVLAQACLIAGNSGREELIPLLKGLEDHPSEVVADAAAWAAKRLEKK